MKLFRCSIILYCIAFAYGCGSKIKVQNDEIYSHHLQKHIQLHIIATPFSKDKSDINLVILNDATLMKIPVKDIVESLYHKNLVGEFLVVDIVRFDPEQLFGVSGTTKNLEKGALAEKYGQFITNELLPFTKK
jgi:enterochelin esterase-like enzyme